MKEVRRSLIDWTKENDYLSSFIVIYMGYTTLELRKSYPELYNIYIQGMLHPSNDRHLVAALLRYFEFYNKQFKETVKNLEDNIKELQNSRFNAVKEYADKVNIQLDIFRCGHTAGTILYLTAESLLNSETARYEIKQIWQNLSNNIEYEPYLDNTIIFIGKKFDLDIEVDKTKSIFNELVAACYPIWIDKL